MAVPGDAFVLVPPRDAGGFDGRPRAGALAAHLTVFHLRGTCAVLNTHFEEAAPDERQDLVYGVAAAEGSTVYRLTLGDEIETRDLQRETAMDLDDAALVHAADVLEQPTVLSLDGHLEHDGEFAYDRLHPRDY